MARNLALLLTLTGPMILLGCKDVVSEQAKDEAKPVEWVTRSEPLRPYPKATRINLLIYDLAPEYGDGEGRSSKPSGTNLTDQQRREFEKSVRKITLIKEGEGGSEAACFDPHHFFRYYDKADKKVGEIAICFCCSNTRETPQLVFPTATVWSDIDIDQAEQFVKSLGLPNDVHCVVP
jgi:hypothetical protein